MDSELQLALIGAGVAVVVLIVGYNRWQEGKHRRNAERAFKSEHRDVLLESPATSAPPEAEREPAAAAAPPPRAVTEAPVGRAVPGLPPQLDARADCIIRLEVIEATEVSRLWQAQAEHLAGVSKPVRWYGFNDADNLWREIGPHSAGACRWFCGGLQLVDRHGSIGETDLIRFSGGVQRIADAVMAMPPALPARAETLQRATELDRFCADLDIQIGVNVVAQDGPLFGLEIASAAQRHDLKLGDDGSFHALDSEGNTLFTVANLEPAPFAEGAIDTLKTSGLTLVIDVPCVASGTAVFERMMALANDLASTLGGAVVDDNRVSFGAGAVALVQTQIAQFQQRMADSGMAAGGALARRLFAA